MVDFATRVSSLGDRSGVVTGSKRIGRFASDILDAGCEALCATQPGKKARNEANTAKKRGRRGKFHLCRKKKQLSVPEESSGWKQNVHRVKMVLMRMTKETYLLSMTLDIRSRRFRDRKKRPFHASFVHPASAGALTEVLWRDGTDTFRGVSWTGVS